MLHQICNRNLVRFVLSGNHFYSRYQLNKNRRLFCFDRSIPDYGGLSINDTQVIKYLTNVRSEYYELINRKESLGRKGHAKINALSEIVKIFESRNVLIENLNVLSEEMCIEKDAGLLVLMKDEKEEFIASLKSLNKRLMDSIFETPEEQFCSSLFLEVSAGVGGKEAMLFANEIHDMYSSYCHYKGWHTDTVTLDTTELGGIRHSSCIVTGDDAFNLLRFEAGVHRVQRIPSTEKAGRIHTSTVTVAVIPKPDDVDLSINEKDLKIETKRASGAGGQHVNTTDSAVRIVHLPTGLAVECQTDRSQTKNKDLALKKLQAKLCQQHFDTKNATTQATRKSQVGSSLRNEKIRTYNYNQDRLTDHRIEGGTLHNLEGFLSGQSALDELINNLRLSNKKNEIIEMIKNVT